MTLQPSAKAKETSRKVVALDLANEKIHFNTQCLNIFDRTSFDFWMVLLIRPHSMPEKWMVAHKADSRLTSLSLGGNADINRHQRCRIAVHPVKQRL